jgi:hypothetical protein
VAGLLAFPLLVLAFLATSAGAAVWYQRRRASGRQNLAAALAAPFGCIALLIGGFAVLGLVGNWLQPSDSVLYEEVFGYRPAMTEDRMLFDRFGRGGGREMFMRAEPTAAERSRLLSIPGAVESDLSLDEFIARGDVRGFTWWISNDSWSTGYCTSARIRDAHGFRGWVEFRMAECLDAGTEFPASAGKGRVYVIASGRKR